MGRLNGPGLQQVVLLSRTLVGRNPVCDVRVDHPTVSGEHAVISWESGEWRVRDLGSRNGTEVDGRPLAPGVPASLRAHTELRFGRDERAWTVADLGPPDHHTALPATAGASLAFDAATFHFEVSADEEHASWSAIQGGRTVDLGDRVHTYLLLTLARLRLADVEVDEPTRGWTYADDLARRLGISPEVMKVYVYRARQQLADAGVLGGDRLVERRATTNQIRFGTDRVVIRKG